MKQVVVISGKGGTGKTTIVASFAALAGRVVMADCDVDAATLHLLLTPKVIRQQEFRGSKLASIDRDKCNGCLLCEKNCRYDAISDLKVDPVLCEGCGVCAFVCPNGAIDLQDRSSGYAYISETRFGPMSHARLGAAEVNSGKLVTLVRNNARLMAETEGLDPILIDGPPGIGCPVIASLTGVNLAIVITEPTLSGLRDLERILALTSHFGVTPLVVINMYDINKANADKTAEFCKGKNVGVLAKISFDPTVTEAMVAGKTVVEYAPSCTASGEIRRAWREVLNILSTDPDDQRGAIPHETTR